MGSLKKVRSVNFDRDEANLLIKYVDEEKGILFNKVTNKITNDAKNEAWERITIKFNATSERQIKRSKDSLIGLWRKTKGQARTTKAFDKRNQFATGGGPPVKSDLALEDQALHDKTLGILGDTIMPLQSNSDSDTGYHGGKTPFEQDVVIETYINENIRQQQNIQFPIIITSAPDPDVSIEDDLNESNVATQNSQSNIDYTKDTTKNEKINFPSGAAKKRPRAVLKSSYEALKNITSKKINQMTRAEENEAELLDIKRKRFKLEEELSKKYEELIDENINYVREKNKREQELHDMQMKILQPKVNQE